MKILQELLAIKLAENQVGHEIRHLSDIIKTPEKQKAAATKLLRSGKLSWHGVKIFDEGQETGPAQKLAYAAALKVVKNSKPVYDGFMFQHQDGSHATVDFTLHPNFHSAENIYTGYDTKNDTMIIGVQCDSEQDDFDRGFETFWQQSVDLGKVDQFGGDYGDVHNQVFEMFMAAGLDKMSFIIGVIPNDNNGTLQDLHAELLTSSFSFEFYKNAINWIKRRPEIIDLVV